MSHTTKVKLEYRDEEALKEALEALKYEYREGKFRLFDGTYEGIGVFLYGWKYPVIFRKNGEKFELLYDRWGTPEKYQGNLDELLRELPEEYAYRLSLRLAKKLEGKVRRYRKNGKTVIEIDVPDEKLKNLKEVKI